MSGIHRAMQDIRQQTQAAMADGQRNEALKDCTDRLQGSLHEMALRLASGDERLRVHPAPSGAGFTLRFNEDSDWNPPAFQVTAHCAGTHVELTAADGIWQYTPDHLGPWGNWSDPKSIYTGGYDEDAIAHAVATAFLPWYQAAVARQAAVERG